MSPFPALAFIGEYGGYGEGKNASTSLIINWQTVGQGDYSKDELEYREKGVGEWKKVSAEDIFVLDEMKRTRKQRYVALDDLDPDTVYEVKFYDGRVNEYKTLPSTLGEIKILMTSDVSPRGSGLEEDLRKGILKQLDPDMILFAGDVGHCSIDPPKNWESFWNGWLSYSHDSEGKSLPIIVSYGNHDTKGGYMKQFFPQVKGTSFGYVDVGDYLTLLFLDSHHIVETYHQNAYIETLLTSKSNRLVIPFFHGSPYAATTDPAREMDKDPRNYLPRQHWTPIFTAHDNVKFVFTGHIHTYGYSPKVTGDELDENGKVYFGQGRSFGMPHRPLISEDVWFVEKTGSQKHVWLLTLNEHQAIMQSYGIDDGNLIDEVVFSLS